MPPILSTSPVFLFSQTQALKHGPFLFLCIIPLVTVTKIILYVMVIRIARCRRLAIHRSLHASLGINSERAGICRRETSGTAIAGEVAPMKQLDELVLAMAGDAARIAYQA